MCLKITLQWTPSERKELWMQIAPEQSQRPEIPTFFRQVNYTWVKPSVLMYFGTFMGCFTRHTSAESPAQRKVHGEQLLLLFIICKMGRGETFDPDQIRQQWRKSTGLLNSDVLVLYLSQWSFPAVIPASSHLLFVFGKRFCHGPATSSKGEASGWPCTQIAQCFHFATKAVHLPEDSYLAWRYFILESISRCPAEYCSITSFTS